MNSVERVKNMCKTRKIPISKLEKDLGFSNGYIGQLRKGVFPDDRLIKIADYFDVSVDYLLTGEEKKWQPTLTDKDERNLDKKVENLLNAVDSDTGLMLDGEIMDEETREIFAMNLKNALRTTKLAAKAKYTPNKYRK